MSAVMRMLQGMQAEQQSMRQAVEGQSARIESKLEAHTSATEGKLEAHTIAIEGKLSELQTQQLADRAEATSHFDSLDARLTAREA
jgi:hypothetical protein